MSVRVSLDTGPFAVRRIRDLGVFDVGDTSIVVACDSSGGIGPKDADTYHAPAAVVAHFAVRVAVLELLAAGAAPVLVVDALSVEADPTGSDMIAAARALIAEIGLGPEALIGSTEDNVPVRATGIGVTAVGVAHGDALRCGSSEAGDDVLCIGSPLSAPADDVYPGHPHIVSLSELERVRSLADVHDILPVGSHGIGYELRQLAATAGLAFDVAPGCSVDMECSGGPATSVLASCTTAAAEAVRSIRADLPIEVVATLRPQGV